MATTLNEPIEITLLDEKTTLSIRPLKISLLREFMTKFEGLSEVAEDNDKSLDLLLECVLIALKQYKPELVEGGIKGLEELLDVPTVYKIIEVASGVKLSEAALINSLVN